MATHKAASVIGGSAMLFRSGQGRCNRPDVAVIFAASQRLSVRASSWRRWRRRPARSSPAHRFRGWCASMPRRDSRSLASRAVSYAVMVAASEPSVEQRRRRGHALQKPRSRAGSGQPDTIPARPHRCGAVAGGSPSRSGRPRSARCPSHQAGSATVTDKGDAIGQAEDGAETDRGGNAANRGAERSPSKRRHHQRQRRQIKQQHRNQRARDDRGEHQRRRAAGRKGNEKDRDHQLSRSFRAVRGSHRTPTIGNRTTRKPYEDVRSPPRANAAESKIFSE